MAETVRSRLRRAVNRLLHPLGVHLIRRDCAFEMDEALGRARAIYLNGFLRIDVPPARPTPAKTTKVPISEGV